MIASNDVADVCEYKTSLKGMFTDYIVTYHRDEMDIVFVLNSTYELFLSIIGLYNKHDVAGRLVAKVNFLQLNQETNEETVYPFHFTSLKTEQIFDPKDFFTRHMYKIAERLDNFCSEGSNLILKNISHVHIHITKLK